MTASVFGQSEENIAAKILSVQGQVEVETPAVGRAQVGQILYAGNVIRTGPRSRAALLMADETQLKLSANSELQLTAVRPTSSLLVRVVEAGPDQSILNMRRGRAWIRSKKTPAAVQVRTPAVTAAIRGTEFDVQVGDDGETMTTVVRAQSISSMS